MQRAQLEGRRPPEWERKVRRIEPQLLSSWSASLYILSSEGVAVYDRLQLACRLADVFSMILWDYTPMEHHRMLVKKKCGVEPPATVPLGQWLLDQVYGQTDKYIIDRFNRIRCILEAIYAIIVDLRTR